jgi:hypothetical protein
MALLGNACAGTEAFVHPGAPRGVATEVGATIGGEGAARRGRMNGLRMDMDEIHWTMELGISMDFLLPFQ